MADEFLAFTGTSDRAQAEQFLEMAGGNLEQAVAIFFDQGASGGGAASGYPGDAAMAEPATSGNDRNAASEESIEQFIMLTQATRADAEKYVSGSGGDAQAAIARFFEGLGPDTPAPTGTGNNPAWYIFFLTAIPHSKYVLCDDLFCCKV